MSKVFNFSCGCSWPVIQDGDPPLLDFDVEKAPQDCKATWEMISSGKVKGIFQLESPLGRQWARKLKPENVEHMSALGALLRPGCLKAVDENGVSMTQHYARRKNGEEPVEVYHESIRDILEPTYGVLAYQEESMAIAQRVAGFNLQEADQLRKCVTKDTRFLSKQRGWVTIATLIQTGYAEDDFLVMDGSGNKSWKKLEKVWSTGKQTVYTVRSCSGFMVRSTKYHQFLTDTGWKARMRLLPKKDYLVTARSVDYDGTDTLSLDLCMVIAGIVTEGHAIEGKRAATFVNHDKGMMSTFCRHFEGVFGCLPSLTVNGRVARFTLAQKKRLAEYMTFGLSDTKRLPEAMMGATKETTRQFLSFVLAAEGGVTKTTGQFEFSSKSRELARQVKLLLLRFGIRSLLTTKKVKGRRETYWRLYVNNLVDQQTMLRELCSSWPESKRVTLEQVVARRKAQNFPTDVVPVSITERFLNQYPFAGRYESGTAFTAPLSRRRFRRMQIVTKDEYWERLADGPQEYDLLAAVENQQKEIETYDFTVAGGDTPYIVADGIVIHNSIGKKLPAEMAKCETMFIEGAHKVGILTSEQAREVFSWIKESQRYSFNKSHAMSYGLTGYDCAYIKAHDPVAFFTSWLHFAKDKQDPYQEIRELVAEARLFDISVEPPDLRRMEAHTNTDRKKVYFGLTDIRGMGDSSFEKMKNVLSWAEAEVGKPLGEFTWTELLLFGLGKISRSVAEKLIQSGSLRWLPVSRRRMVDELAAWAELTDTEQEWALTRERVARGHITQKHLDDERARLLKQRYEFETCPDSAEQESLADDLAKAEKDFQKWSKLVLPFLEHRPEPCPPSSVVPLLKVAARPKKEGGAVHKPSRVGTILSHVKLLEKPAKSLEDSPVDIVANEERLFGASLTVCRVDSCDRSVVNCSCREFIGGLRLRGAYRLGVVINEVRVAKTKRGKHPGSKMAYLNVSDDSGALSDCIAFPEAYKEFGSLLTAGNTVVLQGEREKGEGQTFFVNKAWQLTETEEVM